MDLAAAVEFDEGAAGQQTGSEAEHAGVHRFVQERRRDGRVF